MVGVNKRYLIMGGACAAMVVHLCGCNSSDDDVPPDLAFDPQDTFRLDTFGDEAFWTDVLRYNEVVATISP